MFGRILISAELCAESCNEETSARTARGDPVSLVACRTCLSKQLLLNTRSYL